MTLIKKRRSRQSYHSVSYYCNDAHTDSQGQYKQHSNYSWKQQHHFPLSCLNTQHILYPAEDYLITLFSPALDHCKHISRCYLKTILRENCVYEVFFKIQTVKQFQSTSNRSIVKEETSQIYIATQVIFCSIHTDVDSCSALTGNKHKATRSLLEN